MKDAGIEQMSRRPSVSLPTPQSILDFGGETVSGLGELLDRDMAMIKTNQVLEVVSHGPHGRIDVSAWCLLAGHELLSYEERSEDTLVWIKKRTTREHTG